MKKTLTLLALTTAALIPMIPLAAQADSRLVSVRGVTIDPNNLSNSTGMYDATKDWQIDKGLCWAATCSNLVTWWQKQQSADKLPEWVPTDNLDVWNTYRNAFYDKGGFIEQGVKWWFTGDNGDKDIGNYLYPRTEGSLNGVGGYYKDKLLGGIVPSADLFNLNPQSYGSVANFSTALVSYMENGYGVGMSWISRGLLGGEVGHAVTVWGVELNDNNVVTRLYMTDSDDRGTGLKAVDVTPVWYKGYATLGMASDTNYKVEYFTLLHSTFNNELNSTPPSYLDENTNNVVLKNEVAGGFTLAPDKTEVAQIQYDYEKAYLFRHLTVDHDVTAESIVVHATDKNLLDVESGQTLSVTGDIMAQNSVINSEKILTKTGLGTLELHGTSNVKLEVMAGDLVNDGSLGEVTMSNGGRLVNSGFAKNLTVENGGIAEMKRTTGNAGQTAFTLCNVEEGGLLKGSGNFGKVVLGHGGTLVVGNSPGLQAFNDELVINGGTLVFSIDDALDSWRSAATETNAGWGSCTYSSIDMNNNSITLNPDEIVFALGETILKRSARESDLMDALDRVFTVSLSSVYFLDDLNYQGPVFTMAYAEHLNELAGVTRFKLSEDDEALVEKGLQAEITQQSVRYYTAGNSVLMDAQFNVKLAKAANDNVPEPATSTLSLLALAGFCARRRRK